MTLTPEQLQQVEAMAEALMPPQDIAILIGIAAEQYDCFRLHCLEWTSNDIYAAYQRGRLRTKLALHQNVVKLAKVGSPQAEELAEKYIAAQNL